MSIIQLVALVLGVFEKYRQSNAGALIDDKVMHERLGAALIEGLRASGALADEETETERKHQLEKREELEEKVDDLQRALDSAEQECDRVADELDALVCSLLGSLAADLRIATAN